MSLLPLRRPVVSRTTYLILFACYIGICLNLAFYRQVFPLLPVNSLHNWLVFLSMPIVAISVMNILTTLASFLKLDRLVISLFILLSASAQYFIWNFGVVIDRSMITNILDTTPAESFALLSGEMIAVLGLSGVLAVFEDATQKAVMHNAPRKNLTIVVLGETSRADNFSLGGYSRDTNPLMRQDGVIYFPHTTSCGTATAVSVPCMFSNMPRAHYDEELAHHQEGVLDILQRAGIQVLWNDNDGGCKGACDRVPHQNVTDLKLTGQCIDGECYDDVLFHNLDSYIDNLQQDGIIVLHTIGSHGPTYYNRYPAAFRKFTPTCDTNEIQGCTREQLTNTYDNTILYVDYVVDKAIKLLQSKQDKFTTSLVYLSDHGESLGEDGVYLHGLPYSIAPDTQKHVPMALWLSADYQQRYGISAHCLQQRAQKENYSQDNLFSTLLGLLGVSTREYQAADDILTPCREAG